MDDERNAEFLQAELIGFIGEQQFKKSAQLQLTIYNENEIIVPEVNEEVEVNVIRILAADDMSRAKEEAERGNLEKGREMMETI